MQYLIRHIIIELHACDQTHINDAVHLDTLLKDVAQAMQTDIINGISHTFQPQGVTAMLIVGASHISIHTWPEHAYACFDLVVCTENFDLQQVIDLIQGRVGAGSVNFIEFRRGLIDEHGSHQPH